MKIERVWTKRSLHIGYTDITHWRKSSQGRAVWLTLGIWCTSRYQRSLLRSTGSDTAATIDIRELLNIGGAWADLGFKVCPGARKKTSKCLQDNPHRQNKSEPRRQFRYSGVFWGISWAYRSGLYSNGNTCVKPQLQGNSIRFFESSNIFQDLPEWLDQCPSSFPPWRGFWPHSWQTPGSWWT